MNKNTLSLKNPLLVIIAITVAVLCGDTLFRGFNMPALALPSIILSAVGVALTISGIFLLVSRINASEDANLPEAILCIGIGSMIVIQTWWAATFAIASVVIYCPSIVAKTIQGIKCKPEETPDHCSKNSATVNTSEPEPETRADAEVEVETEAPEPS